MPLVLIPTNDMTILPDIVDGYSQNGCQVVVGVNNLWFESCRPDVIHFLWPEEYSNWQPPAPGDLQRIAEMLERWRHKTTTILSINNLYPHGLESDPNCRKLYSLFLENVDVVAHHSRASQRLVFERYGEQRAGRHIVTTMFAYERMKVPNADRSQIRHELGLRPSDFAYLVFGAIRNHDEITLIRRAYESCSVKNKRLIMAGRYQPKGRRIMRNVRQRFWSLWLRWMNAVHGMGFIPDGQVFRYFEAADAVIVPRLDDLSSGIVGMAMTFGKLIIAPSHGSFPEYLADSDNLLYRSGDAGDLAKRMIDAAGVNAAMVNEANKRRGQSWRWDVVARDCLAASGVTPSKENHV